MATINWTLGAMRKDGSIPVFIKISHKDVRKKMLSSIVLTKNDCVKVDGKFIVKSKKKMTEITNTVSSLQLKTINFVNSRMNVTTQDIYDYLSGKRNKRGDIDFFEFAEEWLQKSNIKGKKNYYTMLNSLSRFLMTRKLPFSLISYPILEAYARSLDSKPRAKSLYLGAIRHLHNEARLRYNTDTETRISPMVFERFKVPRQQLKGQRALDVDVLKKIIGYQGKGRAELARDCFVLSFLLMGMNSADMYDGDAKIEGDKIIYHRKKVRDRRADGAYIEVTIPSEAKELMKKYADKERLFRFHRRYYNESGFNKAINLGLRTVAADIGVDSLQFYQARHTWASIARNECKVDAYTVDKALNHISRDLQMLDVYVKRDYTAINKANKKVIDYVFHPSKKRKSKRKPSQRKEEGH